MSYWNGSQWVPEQPAPPKRASRGRRLLGASLEASLIVLLLFGLVASTALAAKGGGGKGPSKPNGESSLTLVVLAPPDANFGEQVTFDVATSATDQPMVRVDCFQGGTKVYWASAGFYESYPWPWARNFTLQSTYWTGGGADCTATLYLFDGRRYRDLASIAFAAGA